MSVNPLFLPCIVISLKKKQEKMLLHNFFEFDLFLCKFRLPSQLVSGGGLEGDIT